tara:strand:- start:628 stop:789 length:162 start_codon:yes stop_codon:yes gene_type:complete
MFHVWHILAIFLIFILGFLLGLKLTRKIVSQHIFKKFEKDIKEQKIGIYRKKK